MNAHPSARDDWRTLDTKLRAFVSRRVEATSDVDDVVQEIFLRLQRHVGGLRDEERFGPWLYRIARHAIVDHHRSRARRPLTEQLDDETHVAANPSAEDDDAAASATEEVVLASLAPFVAMLPSPYREALTLTELEGLSQRAAAEMLGISISGMKSRVQRGRHLLRRALLDCCHIALDARGRVIDCEPRADGKVPCSC